MFLHTCYIYVCFQLVTFVRKHVAQGLVNGVLKETWTHSCFQYKWPLVGQAGLYRGCCPSFLECVYFGLLYQSLIFDVCVCVCVLALEWFGVSLTVFFCVSVYLGEFCGFKFTGSSFSFFLYMYTRVCFQLFFFCLRTCLAYGLVNGY